MNAADVSWVAGLLEGEGSFYTPKSGRYVGRRMRLRVHMADRWPLDRLRQLTGAGTITGPYPTGKGGVGHFYAWQVSRRDQLEPLLTAVTPWLSPRRQAQVAAMLACVPRPIGRPRAVEVV